MSDHAHANELIANLCLGIVSDAERERREHEAAWRRAHVETLKADDAARKETTKSAIRLSNEHDAARRTASQNGRLVRGDLTAP